MRITYRFLLLLAPVGFLALSSTAQIQYRHLKQDWSMSLTSNARQTSDTLLFFSRSLRDSCKTSWRSGDLIHNTKLEYSFGPKGQMEVYEEEGGMLAPDYHPKMITTTRVDSAGGEMIVEYSEIRIAPPGSAARQGTLVYTLNRRDNILYVKGDPSGWIRYEVLSLSENRMVLRNMGEE